MNVEKVKEQIQKGIEQKKKIKETTRLIQTRIPKELHEQFIKKCEELEQDADVCLKI